MRFLIDAQLPPALARWLGSQGHEAQHVNDIGLGSAQDKEIWASARSSSAVLVSKDDDFLQLHNADQYGLLLWVTMGNTSRAALIRRMELALPEIESAFLSGERLVELR